MRTVKAAVSVVISAALCLSLASCSELREFKYKLHGMEPVTKNNEKHTSALEEYYNSKAPEPEKELYEYKALNDDAGSEYAAVTAYNGDEVKVTVPTKIDEISVKEVGADSFSENENLYHVGIPYGVLSVGDYAFYKCMNLESVVLPSTLTSLGAKAFAYCSALEKVYIPRAVKYIGESAFEECTSLKEIGISGGLVTIPCAAFKNCESVSYIYIPRSVERIEREAFAGCKALKRVDISENVTYIAEEAFEGCDEAVFACPKDSYAEKYASEHGFDVESLSTAQEQSVVDTAESIADSSERELEKEESLLPSLILGNGAEEYEKATSDEADDAINEPAE